VVVVAVFLHLELWKNNWRGRRCWVTATEREEKKKGKKSIKQQYNIVEYLYGVIYVSQFLCLFIISEISIAKGVKHKGRLWI